MIQDPARFAGRRAELDQVLNLLRGMQGVSLVGARRIGKSSLLYHIFLTGHAQLGEETTIAYTDFRGIWDWIPAGEQRLLAVLAAREPLSATQLWEALALPRAEVAAMIERLVDSELVARDPAGCRLQVPLLRRWIARHAVRTGLQAALG